MKRILFLSHYGAHQQFRDFFAEVAKQGPYEVKVIIPKEIIYSYGYGTQVFPERQVIDDVEYIPSNLFDKKRYHLSGYFPELPNTILSFKPDTVVVTDEAYTVDAAFVIFWKLLLWQHYQIVTWNQAHYMENWRALRFPGWILLLMNKPFIKKFVARNHQQADRIRAVLPKRKTVQTVYWSSHPSRFQRLNYTKTELLAKLNLPSHLANQQLIGFVGRVVPDKGVFDVVTVLPELPNNVVFVVAGEGDQAYTQQIKDYLVEHHLVDRCLLLGKKPYEDLLYFYNLIDVLILPTHNRNHFYELFGRVLAEAMMCRTLVLGSSNGGIPEVINNPECTFEQNNLSDLSTKLAHLLILPANDKTALIEKQYQHAMSNFTVAAFAKSLITLLKA